MVPVAPVERDSVGAIAGIVVLVMLVLLLLVLLLLYRCRHKSKQGRVPTVAYSTARVLNSEYEVPDIPHGYHHYYSNPSYHTLSQCGLTPPHLPNNLERVNSVKTTNNQLFSNIKNMERERLGPFGPEYNATLPADWKHHASGIHKDIGAIGMDRSYSYSNSLGKYYNKDPSLDLSSSSLSSENPYATIKDLPVLLGRPSESSYMEMKGPGQRESSYTETGLLMQQQQQQPGRGRAAGTECSSLAEVPEHAVPRHYDLPKNSHIPSHYDLPPVRHCPPSPHTKRLDR